MKIKLEFKTEDRYDEKANVKYNGVVEKGQKIIDKLIQNDMGYFITDEVTNISKIAGIYDDVYLSECRKAWNRLWDYFDVSEYREKCFPSGSSRKKPLPLIDEEKEFLKSYFKKVCRINQDKKSTDKREVKSFLDMRKSKQYSVEELEDIEWAGTNLYQIMRRRIVINEDIRSKFYKKSKDNFYIEKKFEEFKDDLENAITMFNYKKGVLNIKEKKMCVKGLCDELEEVIDKWLRIFYKMELLKQKKPDTYSEDLDGLLNDAIKKENGTE